LAATKTRSRKTEDNKGESKADVPEASPAAPFQLPSIELLSLPDRAPHKIREEDLLASAQHLEKTLADFGVQGKVVEIHPGPIITRFDFTPAPGIKVQAVANLSNDIALAMKAMSVRVLAPIPGKSAVVLNCPIRIAPSYASARFWRIPFFMIPNTNSLLGWERMRKGTRKSRT